MPQDKKIQDLHNLWVLFAMTRDAIYRAAKKEFMGHGITPSQGAVMFVIDALGSKATPTEIARRFFRQHHSISELLIRMERAGLVKRFCDLHKKNLKRYELTEKGREIHLKSIRRKTVERIFSSLSREQRLQLQSLLHILFREAMEELGMKNNKPLPPVISE